MKITKIEDLHCDAGWRVNSFLKITTDEGITGWSEYMEGYGAQGLTGVIQKLGARLIGQDPRPVVQISALLYAVYFPLIPLLAWSVFGHAQPFLPWVKSNSSASRP